MATVVKDQNPARHTGAGIDPARLRFWRESRGMSRATLARSIGELGWTDPDTGGRLTLTRDAAGKFEHPEDHPNRLRPRPAVLAAIAQVLGVAVISLQPGGPAPELPEPARARELSRQQHRALVAFAEERGLRIRNDSGRIYPYKDTVRAFEALVAFADQRGLRIRDENGHVYPYQDTVEQFWIYRSDLAGLAS